MYKDDLISIIMPAYNAETFIERSINSVLQQTYTEWELIVINDCSIDSTKEKILEFDNRKIKLINNDANLGVADSRNTALNQANGRFIAFLDSDDLWFPNKLELQIKKLQSDSNAVCCHTGYVRIDDKDNYLANVPAKKFVDSKLMRKGNFIGNLTGMIDRKKYFAVKQKKIKHEDFIMWLEVLHENTKFYSIGIDMPLAKYRVHSESISANKIKSAIWHWNILRGSLNLNLVSSSYYLLHYIINAIWKRV